MRLSVIKVERQKNRNMFKPLRSNPYFRFQRTCNPTLAPKLYLRTCNQNPNPQIIPMVRKRNIYRWREREKEREYQKLFGQFCYVISIISRETNRERQTCNRKMGWRRVLSLSTARLSPEMRQLTTANQPIRDEMSSDL